jgi:hypothetical protein
MAYHSSFPNEPQISLNDFACHANYEEFVEEYEHCSHISIAKGDSYHRATLGKLFLSSILFKNKLRIFAFLLKKNVPLDLNLKNDDMPATADFRVATVSQLPLFIIKDATFNHSFPYCNIPALLRLILYYRGIEPFETIKDNHQRNAVWYYTEGCASKRLLSNGEKIPAFMEQAWTEIQAHQQLIKKAKELIQTKNYTEAYQIFDTAASQLKSYSEGDEALRYFYEEEILEIYNTAVSLHPPEDRAQMIFYISTMVLNQIKKLHLDLKEKYKAEQALMNLMQCPPPPTQFQALQIPLACSSSSNPNSVHKSKENSPDLGGMRHRKGFIPKE